MDRVERKKKLFLICKQGETNEFGSQTERRCRRRDRCRYYRWSERFFGRLFFSFFYLCPELFVRPRIERTQSNE